jgi:hypothetical protein
MQKRWYLKRIHLKWKRSMGDIPGVGSITEFMMEIKRSVNYFQLILCSWRRRHMCIIMACWKLTMHVKLKPIGSGKEKRMVQATTSVEVFSSRKG